MKSQVVRYSHTLAIYYRMDKEFSVAELLGITEEELEAIAPANPKPSIFPLTLKSSKNRQSLDSNKADSKLKPDEEDSEVSEKEEVPPAVNDMVAPEVSIINEPTIQPVSTAKPQVAKPTVLGAKPQE